MTFWTDKDGNKLTFKQFMSKWKGGIEGITPLQRLKTQINGTRLMLIGINLGIVMSLIAYKQMWWVGIILLGALFNTFIQYVSLKQQYNILLNIEEQFKGGNK